MWFLKPEENEALDNRLKVSILVLMDVVPQEFRHLKYIQGRLVSILVLMDVVPQVKWG